MGYFHGYNSNSNRTIVFLAVFFPFAWLGGFGFFVPCFKPQLCHAIRGLLFFVTERFDTNAAAILKQTASLKLVFVNFSTLFGVSMCTCHMPFPFLIFHNILLFDSSPAPPFFQLDSSLTFQLGPQISLLFGPSPFPSRCLFTPSSTPPTALASAS